MLTTESESPYEHLDCMTTAEILQAINSEDQTVPNAVAHALPAIEKMVSVIILCMQQGGRLFYIGAGTSGRLGVVDASECPPTFGVTDETVIGLIAGGEQALRKGIEGAEDSPTQGWLDLQAYKPTVKDFVIGIAASGRTPYVLAALQECRKQNIATGCIVCNSGSIIAQNCDYPVEVPVGPEIISGSTRMKAGTAQKLVLNMVSTTVMIKLGRVLGNHMIYMQLTNEKLVARGVRVLQSRTQLTAEQAEILLKKHGSVGAALQFLGLL